MAKRPTQKHQPFESKTERGKFTKICNDMMASAAWEALNRSQRCLYLELKSKYTAKMSSGQLISDNSRDISMPATEAKGLYADLRTFRADIDRLIECGFIDTVQRGWNMRIVNVYGFSDRWKEFGTPGYFIPENVLRVKRKPTAK